jgi:hypothetical protein
MVSKLNPRYSILRPNVVGWSNHFGLIESGNSDIDVISVRLAGESEGATAHCTERPYPAGPCDFERFSLRKLKLAPVKRSPGHKWRASALATIFAMAVSDVVDLAAPLVSHSAAQATAANRLWLCFHRKLPSNRAITQ